MLDKEYLKVEAYASIKEEPEPSYHNLVLESEMIRSVSKPSVVMRDFTEKEFKVRLQKARKVQ